MSTRGIIAKFDGKNVRYIRVRWDNYPTGTGICLLNHYQKEDKIDSLIALGDLASIGSVIGDKISPDPYWSSADKNGSDITYQEQCVSYVRDYEYEDVYKDICVTHETDIMNFLFGYNMPSLNQNIEWVYIRVDGEWNFSERELCGEKYLLNSLPLVKLTQENIDVK